MVQLPHAFMVTPSHPLPYTLLNKWMCFLSVYLGNIGILLAHGNLQGKNNHCPNATTISTSTICVISAVINVLNLPSYLPRKPILRFIFVFFMISIFLHETLIEKQCIPLFFLILWNTKAAQADFRALKCSQHFTREVPG